MAWSLQDLMGGGMNPNALAGGMGGMADFGAPAPAPQEANPLQALMQGAMGQMQPGGQFGGQAQNPLMGLMQQLLPQLLKQQQTTTPQIGMPQLQRLLMLKSMQDSPFYQGQPVRGAGSQIMQAMLPILMARAQAPILAQEYAQKQSGLQGKGLETIMKAMTAMMGLQTAQAESQRATAQANKTNLEAQNIPQELAIKQAAKAETERHQREVERISNLEATERIAATKAENARQQDNVNSLIAFRNWKKENPQAGAEAKGLERSYIKVGDKFYQTVLNKKTNKIEFALTPDGQRVELASPPGYFPGDDYTGDQAAATGKEGGLWSAIKDLVNQPTPGVNPSTSGIARGSNPTVPADASPVSDNQKSAGKSVAPPVGKGKQAASATGKGRLVYDPDSGEVVRE